MSPTKSRRVAVAAGNAPDVNYSGIIDSDIANGEGIRTSLFVSGCRHHCKGCFNPGTWDFAAGEPFTLQTQEFVLSRLAKPYVAGLSLLGGEPLEPENQIALLPLLREMKRRMPEKTVWCYTGCVLEKDLAPGAKSPYRTEVTDEFLSYVDVLVDGPFVEELKDISLRFRGSSNQRILHLRSQTAHSPNAS